MMPKSSWFLYVPLFVALGLASACAGRDAVQEPQLWPAIEPLETGYLRVSDIHEIYYELSGNPTGRPVFVLHGGPGSGSSPHYRRFFNPARFLIVQHDQRGAGQSRPFAELRENTTRDLVEDIEKLRRHLKQDGIILFGGSWGSTLGLAYAETYPQHVSGMVLRGIFTATKQELDHFYHGGVRAFFPEVYDQLVESFDESERQALPAALLARIQSEEAATRDKYGRLWAKYEYKIAALDTPDDVVRGLDQADPREFHAFSLIENYYMANNCFLEEGQLLENAGKLAGIPTVLVNGRYDLVCPPITAYRLHQRIPQSRLVIAEAAGHWLGDRPVEKGLLEAMAGFE